MQATVCLAHRTPSLPRGRCPEPTRARNFVSNKGYKKYVTIFGDDNEGATLNIKQIEQDEKADGFFAVVTNVKDQSSEEILKNYRVFQLFV